MHAPDESEHPTQPLWRSPAGGDPGYPGGPWVQPPTSPPPRRRLGVGLAALLLVIGAAVGAGVARLATGGGGLGRISGDGGTSSSQAPAGQGSGVAPGGGTTSDISSVVSTVSPAVVDINVTIGYQGAQGAGTGMVLTSTGEVLTNNHVIAGASKISVTDVGNGRTYSARVVGYDRSDDIAVLELDNASGLKTVSIGDSSQVQVGAAVVGIGNGGGTGGAPSSAVGTVTALDQQITASDQSNGTSQTYTGLIQTDADIVPGYSGGPLVDAQGRVIGIDTAASAGFQFRSSGTEGFAIPINTAMEIAHRIESGDASTTVHIGETAMLGVSVQSSGDASSGDGSSGGSGAEVAAVVSGGPADQAGITAGDLITSVDGHTVTSADGLTELMLQQRPGDSVTVTYTTAGGDEQTTTVTLDSGPPQ